MSRGLLYSQTLRAQLAPRRLLPAVVVTAAMVATELAYTGSGAAIVVDLVLCLIFWFHAPFAWRWLCSSHRPRTPIEWTLGHAGYFGSGAAIVGLLGLVLPLLGQLPWTYMTDLRSLGVVLALYLVGGWGLGRDIDLEEGLIAERQRAEQLARTAEQAQLLAIRSHLDPHFLFNTLNAISEWCVQDPPTAEAATLKLAHMLRQVLSGVRAEAWPLARELELLGLLFDLYSVRDPERFRFDVELPELIPEVDLPPLILLPLAENAIKHGPMAGHEGAVVLRISEAEERLRIELINPGPFAARRPGGQGLDMVERRLDLAYGGQALLSIEARDEETVAVVEIHRDAPK
jgi:hypothetical protein